MRLVGDLMHAWTSVELSVWHCVWLFEMITSCQFVIKYFEQWRKDVVVDMFVQQQEVNQPCN